MSYDLLALRTPRHGGTGKVRFNLFDEPAVVRGIQLLAQRFVTLLLRRSDVRFDRGTDLLASVASGRAATEPLLTNFVSIAISDIGLQLQRTGDPDEVLQSVTILSVSRTKDGAVVKIRLIAQSGAETVIELPRVL